MRRDRRHKREWSDQVLVALGLLIAGFAAFFPWYVFLNQDQFGIRPVRLASSGAVPIPPGPVPAAPSAVPDRNALDGALDTITTATVSATRPGRPAQGGRNAPQQPFPTGNPGFRLLHVANGRALIEDGKGMYMVHIGSVLPDDSLLATLEKRDGRWVIVTSKGAVIER